MATDPTTLPTIGDIQQAKKDMTDINTFVASEQNAFTDNTGKPRKTMEGILADVQIGGQPYESVSDGLTATSEGNYFSVVSPDVNGYLDLYKNESDVAAFKKSYPSVEFVKLSTIGGGKPVTLIGKLILNAGAFIVSGNGVANTEYTRTSTSSNLFECDPLNNDYFYTGEIAQSNYVAVVYRDENSQFIDYELTGVGSYDRVKLTPPTNAKFIATCSLNSKLPIIEQESRFFTGEKAIDGVNELSQLIAGDYEPVGISAFQSGAISKFFTGADLSVTDAGYQRASFNAHSNMIAVNSDNYYYYTGNIDNDSYAGVLFLDSAMNYISVTCDSVRSYNRFELDIPSDAAYIIHCSAGGDPLIERRSKKETQKESDLESVKYAKVAGTVSTANGYLTKTGGSVTTSTHRRTSATGVSSMFKIVDIESGHFYSGNVNNGSMAGVLYIDESGQFIDYECGDIKVYENFKLTIPSNAKYIATSAYQDEPLITYNVLRDFNVGQTLHVSKLAIGSFADGSIAKPYPTISDAINSTSSSARILVGIGDYRETLPFDKLKSGKYEIVGREGQRVRVLGSDVLSGFTDNGNNVWKATFNGVIPDFPRLGGKLIFEDGNPSKEITDNPHPLQRSLTHRLPFTALLPKASIAEVEAQAGTYHHDGSDIYVHTSDGSNPNANGFSYEVIVRDANTFVDIDDQKEFIDLHMQNIQFMFNNGVISNGFSSVTRYNCTCLASYGDGAFRNDTGYIETWFEEAGFCEVDGENSHYNAFSGFSTGSDNRSNHPNVVHNYLWTHDNGDDGESSHENHNVVINGMLTEWNGDSGSRPASDATYFYTNCHARKNGWEVTNNWTQQVTTGGEGFAIVGTAQNPNRQGCRVIVKNSISEENAIGYGSFGGDKGFIEVINSISRNNSSAEYSAINGSKLVVRNSRATNADPLKLKVTSSGGVIEVINDDLLT